MGGKDDLGLGPVQAARRLGLTGWQFEAALRRGLLGESTRYGWPVAEIEDAAARIEEIRAQLPEGPPVGAVRSAERITERLNEAVMVTGLEVEALAQRGLLVKVGDYKGHALYDQGDLDAVADEHAQLLEELVADRQAWWEASCFVDEACARLGWTRTEFAQVRRARGLEPGRFDRWASAVIEELAADEELAEQVRRSRLLGPDQAAEHLQIRRRDFDYLTAAGMLTPATHVESRVGQRRYVTVALYEVGAVEDLLDFDAIDWEGLRGLRAGAPSPLRELTALPIERATLVRGLAADLSQAHGVAVDPTYDYRGDVWRLRWRPNAAGEPSKATVSAEIADRPPLRPHVKQIVLVVDDREP